MLLLFMTTAQTELVVGINVVGCDGDGCRWTAEHAVLLLLLLFSFFLLGLHVFPLMLFLLFFCFYAILYFDRFDDCTIERVGLGN